MNIKAFIFDLDGVITETIDFHYNAWVNELSKHNIHFSKEENSKFKGLSRMETLVAILKQKNKLNNFSQKELEKMSLNKNNYYKELLEARLSSKNILPGIIDFLNVAQRNGIKLAIASSSHNAPKILKKIGLINYFEFIVNPNDVENGKPAPDIFLQACKGVSVEPRDAIGFEDAIEGVKGLRRANIKAVAITWGDPNNWSIAQMVLKSTKDLDFNKIIKL